MRTSRFGERPIQEQGSSCEFLFLSLAFSGRGGEPAHSFIQRSKLLKMGEGTRACTFHCIAKKSRRAVVGSQAPRTGHGTERSRSEPSERRFASSVGSMSRIIVCGEPEQRSDVGSDVGSDGFVVHAFRA
ncbi:hypothetical protein ISCGN_018162 [Ixodes scapularis]